MFQIQTIDRVKNKPPLLPKIFLVQVKSNSICFLHKKDLMTIFQCAQIYDTGAVTSCS